MKVYDLVKQSLEQDSECRNNDKRLIWYIWYQQGHTITSDGHQVLTYANFNRATSPETIRRCRQKIQELHPELGPSETVAKRRRHKADEKGTFIYREVAK